MAAAKAVEARYGSLHNISMAVVSAGMISVTILHFVNNPANAPTLSMNDPRFVLFSLLALALGYYVFVGISRTLNRRPQIVIDFDGIALGFGRDRRFAWDDIQWARLRRLALRQQLEIGIAPSFRRRRSQVVDVEPRRGAAADPRRAGRLAGARQRARHLGGDHA